MKVLAIDLASRQTGWALFDDQRAAGGKTTYIEHGIICPRPKSLTADERLPVIEKEIQALIDAYKPSHVILEQPAGGAEDKGGPQQNWLTMSVLFLTHGVVRNILQKTKTKYTIVSPSTWQNRLGIFKRDRASRKAGARDYVCKTWGLSESLDQDIYDAFCLYDCWVYMQDWDKNEKEVSAF